MKNEIILFENEDVKLEINVDFEHETVWGTQEQISKLFETERSVITKHINKIFRDDEVNKESNVQKMHNTNLGKFKPVNLYSLDVILAVGYRTNSKKAIEFRKWANKILKQYILEGYVVNQRRLEYLEKTVRLIDIATRIDEEVGKEQGQQILKVIKDYTLALDLLDNYDYKEVKKPSGTVITDKKLEYEKCLEVISKMKFNEKSNLFALERGKRIRIYYK